MPRYYPKSKVEISGFSAKHYDFMLNIMTLGKYVNFINDAVKEMKIEPDDKILDLGAGTGRNACLMGKYLTGKGEILGLEISEQMVKQFERKTQSIKNINLLRQRIDKPFVLEQSFDKVFISFVIHGFPHEVRAEIIGNAFNALKSAGEFIILDFSEFVLSEMPLLFRVPFKAVECPYAFDFIERDWKQILRSSGFDTFEEHYYFKNYVRLLIARKKE